MCSRIYYSIVLLRSLNKELPRTCTYNIASCYNKVIILLIWKKCDCFFILLWGYKGANCTPLLCKLLQLHLLVVQNVHLNHTVSRKHVFITRTKTMKIAYLCWHWAVADAPGPAQNLRQSRWQTSQRARWSWSSRGSSSCTSPSLPGSSYRWRTETKAEDEIHSRITSTAPLIQPVYSDPENIYTDSGTRFWFRPEILLLPWDWHSYVELNGFKFHQRFGSVPIRQLASN